MKEILIRFLVGGIFVSFFAILGDLFKPKSFAGLFGAAPSIAIATLLLTIRKDGALYASIEAHSMLAGAIAFFVYASAASWIMLHKNRHAFPVSASLLSLWGAVAFSLWYLWWR